MKYNFEMPVVQVAHIQSVNDLEWVQDALGKGEIFDRLVFAHANPEFNQVYVFNDVKVLADYGYAHFSRNLDSHTVSVGDTYIVWNQSKEAYAVKSVHGFTPKMIPQELKQLVVVGS